MKNFKTVICLAAFLFILPFGKVSADSFDNLQAALISGKYTLRYENITPPSQKTVMKERRNIFNGQMSDPNDYLMYVKISGFITGDGKNQYIETFSERGNLIYSVCMLSKDNELFNFSRIEDKEKKKIQYTSQAGNGKVSAIPIQSGLVTQISFGNNADLNKVLHAILPDSQKAEGAIIYKKVKSGFLKNGLEYVDLKAVNLPQGIIFDAIRYYFQDGELVKIATGQYFGFGNDLDGRRTIIKVNEFKNSAETNFLKLPAELKDITQRDKKAKG